jgi:hypothetical protein
MFHFSYIYKYCAIPVLVKGKCGNSILRIIILVYTVCWRDGYAMFHHDASMI